MWGDENLHNNTEQEEGDEDGQEQEQLPSAAKNVLQTFGITHDQEDYEASFGSDSAHEC